MIENIKKDVQTTLLSILVILFPILTFTLYFLNEPRFNLILVELISLHPLYVFFFSGFLFPYSIFFAVLAMAAGILSKKMYDNTVIAILAAYWIYSHRLIFLWTYGRMYLEWHFG